MKLSEANDFAEKNIKLCNAFIVGIKNRKLPIKILPKILYIRFILRCMKRKASRTIKLGLKYTDMDSLDKAIEYMGIDTYHTTEGFVRNEIQKIFDVMGGRLNNEIPICNDTEENQRG